MAECSIVRPVPINYIIQCSIYNLYMYYISMIQYSVADKIITFISETYQNHNKDNYIT